MKKYSYQHRVKRELITSITTSPAQYTLDYINELGQQGELVVNIVETTEPSQISSGSGQPVPYFVMNVLTVKEIEETSDDEPRS